MSFSSSSLSLALHHLLKMTTEKFDPKPVNGDNWRCNKDLGGGGASFSATAGKIVIIETMPCIWWVPNTIFWYSPQYLTKKLCAPPAFMAKKGLCIPTNRKQSYSPSALAAIGWRRQDHSNWSWLALQTTGSRQQYAVYGCFSEAVALKPTLATTPLTTMEIKDCESETAGNMQDVQVPNQSRSHILN